MQQHINKNSSPIILFISQVGLGGYLKYAPGTYGAAIGGLLGYILIKYSWTLTFICTLILLVIGIYTSSRAEKILKKKDPSSVVIDEVVGQLITLLFMPHVTMATTIMAFGLFRFFDILKPWPIKSMEETFEGGMAIMADDVLAGMISGIVCLILLLIIK